MRVRFTALLDLRCALGTGLADGGMWMGCVLMGSGGRRSGARDSALAAGNGDGPAAPRPTSRGPSRRPSLAADPTPIYMPGMGGCWLATSRYCSMLAHLDGGRQCPLG